VTLRCICGISRRETTIFCLYKLLGTLYITIEGRESINFHLSDFKNLRIWPLNSSHKKAQSKGCHPLNYLHGKKMQTWKWWFSTIGWVSQKWRPKLWLKVRWIYFTMPFLFFYFFIDLWWWKWFQFQSILLQFCLE